MSFMSVHDAPQPRMTPTHRVRMFFVFAAVLALGIAGCSNSKSPTNPYGGGGGGGNNSGPLALGPFAIGQSASFTFANAGTFGYHCIVHQAMGMTGTVQVDSSGADSLVVQIGPGNGFTFGPASAHIKPGGYVRWVNVSNLAVHTVTSN